MNHGLPLKVLFAALAAGAAAGCVGSVGDASKNEDPKAPPGDRPADPTMPTQPGQQPTDPVTPPMVAAPGTCGAPMFTTVLTREQYINTVSDLLGVDVRGMVTFSDAAGRKFNPQLKRSALEAEGFMSAARTIADQTVTAANLTKLIPCASAGDSKCADQFIDRFGGRATRRPLTAEMRSDLRALYDAGQAEGGFATGLKWVVEGLLQSPEFLYHLVTPSPAKAGTVVNLDDFDIADRLAYFLWNSGPDDALWTSAESGKLHTTAELTAQVARMRKDPRAARAREDFYGSLLSLDLIGSLTRDDAAYTPELAKALEKSMLAGIHNVFEGDGKSDSLMGSSTVYVDSLMAKLYGAPASAGATGTDVKPAKFEPNQRRGLLTHPALMATIAEHDTSDPIHRGTFVYTKVLCQNIPSPPDAVPALPTLGENLTTRQRLVEHRSAPACSGCHSLFDPIGLAFENFDSLGRFRSDEHGSKIDSSGEIIQGDLDVAGAFSDGFVLFDRLATSKNVRGCMAQQWYEYASRRDIEKNDSCGLDSITSRFKASGDLNELLASIALSETFRNRLVTQE
jgi:hypothetical protein